MDGVRGLGGPGIVQDLETTPGQPKETVLVGRDCEEALLGGIVASAGTGGGAALVLGEAGIGKTALLRRLAGTAPASPLWLRGSRCEATLPFAVAADLLRPLLNHLDAVPAAQAQALRVALGLAEGRVPPALTLCTGALGVLGAAARDGPLVVFVDDLQWVDAQSRQLLAFISRRLKGERLVILLAGRPGGRHQLALPDLPTLLLSGLDLTACRTLARASGVVLPDAELVGVLDRTGGNPRALFDSLRERGAPEAEVVTVLPPPAARIGAPVSGILPAEPALCGDPMALAATVRRALDLTLAGHPRVAHEELTSARHALAEEPTLAAEVGLETTVSLRLLGHARRASGEASSALGAEGFPATTLHHFVTAAAAHAMHGQLDLARDLISRLDARDAVPSRTDTEDLATLAEIHIWLEELDAARQLIAATVDHARRDHATTVLPRVLLLRGELGFQEGCWPAAHRDATDALDCAEDLGQPVIAGYGLVLLARIEALRGERAMSEDHLARCRERIGPFGIDALRAHELAVAGLNALTHDEPDVAVGHLQQAWFVSRRDGLDGPLVVLLAGDLAEALVRCGDRSGAAVVAEWLAERASATGLVQTRTAAGRIRGLLAADLEAAAAAFTWARAAGAARPSFPFEQARTLLCEGEVLRRLRRPQQARAVLRQAQQRFVELGARPWAQRAARELIAAGEHPARKCDATDLACLTPQELQIARMVAVGLNNVETAAALFLSRKTIEAHLSRIYRKLAIRSRTELARTLLGHGVTS